METQTREEFKMFYGTPIYILPKLLAEGRIPVSVAMVMKQRLIGGGSTPRCLQDRCDTSDLLISTPRDLKCQNRKIILTIDANKNITETGRFLLNLINPYTRTTENTIALPRDIDNVRKPRQSYDTLKGPGIIELKSSDLGGLMYDLHRLKDKEHSLEKITQNRIWRILARHPDEVPDEFAEDRHLLQDYAKLVRREYKGELGRNGARYKVRGAAMGFEGVEGGNYETSLIVWYLDSIKEHGSIASCRRYLTAEISPGHFVGLSPKGFVPKK